MRLPYVIDNRTEDTSMRRVLGDLLALHTGKAVDVASAFFSIRGFGLLAGGLETLGSFRLLLGAEPRGGLDIGLHVDPRAGRICLADLTTDLAQADAAILRRELERAPLDEQTQRLVEDLIRFLRHDWVEVRRYDRGFLHAKTWLFYADRTRSGQGILLDRFQPLLGIVGSSNFTYPGLTGNNELNLSHQVLLEEEQADDPGAAGMVRYLGEESASARITPKNRQLIKSEVGARAIQQLVDWYDVVWAESVDYKEQFIEVLTASKYGEVEYTPYQIYLKALWHYFRDDVSETPPERPTEVDLAEFQEDAVKRAQRILAKYSGVMIADSVGLGKTWIGKRLLEEFGYFERQKVLVVCPASLRSMWQKELHDASIANVVVTQEIMGQPGFDPFQYGDADVILVDESHNFRNHRSQRYEGLEQIITCHGGRGKKSGQRKKIILLTATPINNDLFDLYNQVNLVTQGDDGYFAAAGIGDLQRYFRAARKRGDGEGTLNLFNLLEEVSVRRPRSFIRDNYPNATIGGVPIRWPERELHTEHYSLADTYGREFYRRIVDRIEALHLAPFDLESYRRDPSKRDDFRAGRGQALVGIFKSLYLKRFESSVEAFRISIRRARDFQVQYLAQLREGRLLTTADFRRLAAFAREEMADQDTSEERDELLSGLEAVALADYDLAAIELAVEADLQMLSEIIGRVDDIGPKQDAKWQCLRDMLRGDLKGQKVLIFTYYRDTSRYLYRLLREDEEFLTEAGGPTVRVADSGIPPSERERLVELFAPRSNHAEGIQGTDREIDILVSTDVLAEGKNLQDCQYLINYDLHWAPTRLVQRAGRIDRIGTEFDLLHLHNFFPESDLEDLLRLVATLQSKIEAIDDQGLHDASVLGETPHPRAFNEVKRIEAEDATIMDEEERSLELASSEGLRLQLQQAMQQGYDQQMEELPDGIHSVRTVRGDRGIFFCFEAHPDSPERRRAMWIYWDHHRRSFDDNLYRIAQLIACSPEEPRGVTEDSVYDLLPKAIEFLTDSSKRTVASQEARHKVTPEQTAIRNLIGHRAIQAGVGRERVLSVLQFLNQPMARFAQRHLRQSYQAFAQTDDITALVDAVDDLRIRFQGSAEGTEAPETDPLAAEDLHLVCFEYIT